VIKNRLIAARKEKNMTQSEIADLLFISQSQYQRREQGEIHISDGEWLKIAKILKKDMQDIKEEDYTTTNIVYDNQAENYSANNHTFHDVPDFIIKNQQEYIEALKEEIKRLKEEISRKPS